MGISYVDLGRIIGISYWGNITELVRVVGGEIIGLGTMGFDSVWVI